MFYSGAPDHPFVSRGLKWHRSELWWPLRYASVSLIHSLKCALFVISSLERERPISKRSLPKGDLTSQILKASVSTKTRAFSKGTGFKTKEVFIRSSYDFKKTPPFRTFEFKLCIIQCDQKVNNTMLIDKFTFQTDFLFYKKHTKCTLNLRSFDFPSADSSREENSD